MAAFYTVKKGENGGVVIQARDPDAKQTIWSWASDQGDEILLYGSDVPGGGYGDWKWWQWTLTPRAIELLTSSFKTQLADPKRFEATAKENKCARELLAKMKKATASSGTKLDKFYHESFLQAYVEAALYSTNDESDENGGEPMDKNYSWDNFAASTKRAFKKDCDAFIKQGQRDLVAGLERGLGAEQAGHDFWLTREGHGAGFWDGDWPEPLGKNLTALSKKFGEAGIYIADKKVYQMGREGGGKRRHTYPKHPQAVKLHAGGKKRHGGGLLRLYCRVCKTSTSVPAHSFGPTMPVCMHCGNPMHREPKRGHAGVKRPSVGKLTRELQGMLR